jgi:uncharacterized membrane protein (DUF373 family)
MRSGRVVPEAGRSQTMLAGILVTHHRSLLASFAQTMLKIVQSVEGIVVRVLIWLMLLAIVLGTIELGRVLFAAIIHPPFLLLDISTLFDAFGLFLVILIGLELLKSMQFFLSEKRIKPEMVIEVAIIALCNKIITLNLKTTAADSLLGMAALLIGLAAGYYILQRRPETPNE